MTSVPSPPIASQRKRPPLLYVLGFASLLFIGILVVVYFITKQSNPVMLDEHGKPVATAPFQGPAQKVSLMRT